MSQFRKGMNVLIFDFTTAMPVKARFHKLRMCIYYIYKLINN